MIVGIGLDVVDADQMRRLLAGDNGRFEERVFTPAEREECRGRSDRDQALAARFAAKEACVKALGTGWSRGVAYHQVEVLRADDAGAPTIRLTGAAAELARARGVLHIHVSLSHQAGIAAAAVILER